MYSLQYTWNNLTFTTEYMRYDTQSEVQIDEYQAYGIGYRKRPIIRHQGYYGHLAYRFTDWFELGMGYSESYPDKDDKEGKYYYLKNFQATRDFQAWLKTIKFVTRFDIGFNWTIKFEGNYNDGLGTFLAEGLNPNDDELERYWFLFASKATFNF